MPSQPFNDVLLDFPSVPQTVASMQMTIEAIDNQIDEIDARKERLQLVRAALAGLTGTNRDDTSKVKRMTNGADRAQYEGANT
ncbi:MAG: hypothetical protein KDJ43_08305 [Rhizobiaceae bacterium]|nr:hypothetical protein [Rhizobiaceae bacterium]